MTIADYEIQRWLLDEVECLRAENAELKISAGFRAEALLISQSAKLAKACEALQFYADGHKGPRGKPEKHEYRALCDRCRDKGDRARQVLKEIL